MARVKVLFHDNCFDGAASASLFRRFYASCIDSQAEFAFAGKSHGALPVYDDASFDGDVNAVVDFRYSADPRLTWWFDHHVSAFPSPADEKHFAEHPGEHQFFDPKARSCTKFLAQTCATKFGWDWTAHKELVHWADLIDGAKFESPQAAVELGHPALRLMTWVENNHDRDLKTRFIDELTTRSLADIAAERYVEDALTPILARHERAIDVMRARIKVEHRVVYFDVIDDGLEGYNKFIPYYLHPDCRYVVGVSRGSSMARCKISVGSNPWSAEKRTVNIAQICERYGGGGHPVVGAISVGAAEVDRARTIAAEITAELAVAADRE